MSSWMKGSIGPYCGVYAREWNSGGVGGSQGEGVSIGVDTADSVDMTDTSDEMRERCVGVGDCAHDSARPKWRMGVFLTDDGVRRTRTRPVLIGACVGRRWGSEGLVLCGVVRCFLGLAGEGSSTRQRLRVGASTTRGATDACTICETGALAC
jgi:hypothetical protein